LANINDFWELFDVAGGGTSTDLTRVLDSIVKSDRAKIDAYFTSVIDQISYNTEDWKRLRAFLVDLYAAHRAIATQGSVISDPSNLSNDELDELFRSFGYPESPQLRDFDNNPLVSKILLFLTLVDLYKIKGTPQSVLEILQFYGISELDIYEFWLEKLTQDSLHFKGDVITGTSVNPASISLNYHLLTSGDPHWLLTEDQILNLDKINDINLPSKSPYFAVQPIISFGAEPSVTVRLVQDQYENWKNTGVLPTKNAELTILGEIVSLLELYLAAVYKFNEIWSVGYKGDRFVCYDGSSSNTIQIISEYDSIVSAPITRDNIPIKLLQYYDQFTRETPRQFLQNTEDAGIILNIINPALKASLDALPDDDEDVLQSLLKDLGVWVRNNIGFGFVNSGYITFGLKNLFDDLERVIDFFKPYRARLILLEQLKFDNRLFHSIRVEDELQSPLPVDIITHDYLTADSIPCCNEDFLVDATSDITLCTDTGVLLPDCEREYLGPTGDPINFTGLWREGFGYFPDDVVIGADANDYICIASHTSTDSTKPIYGSGWATYWQKYSQIYCSDSTTGHTFYSRETYDCGSYHDMGSVTDLRRVSHNHNSPIFPPNDTTSVLCTGVDNVGAIPEELDLLPIENDFHTEIITRFDDRMRCYHCSEVDNEDSYDWDSTSGTWVLNPDSIEGCNDLGCDNCLNDGYCRWRDSECYTHSACSDCVDDCYSKYLGYDFIRPPIDTEGFVNSDWTGEPPQFYDDTSVTIVTDSTAFHYFQSGGFADFDTGGSFDCTHGFDLVEITIEENLAYILKEDGGYLLQESGFRLQLEEGNIPT